MEVMGLMLGQFVDDFTINCVDVFAMPQSGTGVSVEAVDPVFQQQMLDMLKQTGRPEMVVGWYHSHPGFGCWLSGVDINPQQSFEALNQRAVAVVVDPIQSVKGKVVIDCFRSINPQMIMLGQEPRQTTSNVGHLNKPSLQAQRLPARTPQTQTQLQRRHAPCRGSGMPRVCRRGSATLRPA